MKNKKVNIDRLNEELFEVIHSNPELVDDFLREDGYNPETVEKNGISKVKALLFKHTVEQKRVKLSNLYERAIASFQEAAVTTKEAILARLRQNAPALQFKNLEKLDEEHLKEILNETELLDLIDKLDKGDI